jgi:hypothetical protein
MSLNAKIAIVLTAATTVFAPIAANAGETSTGATAAAVSIKFNDCSKKCGGTEGGFSITPGGNTTGFGSGVRELSAAVATGETSAVAMSSSNRFGTSASANGYSAPVSFSYEVIKSYDSNKFGLDITSSSKYTQEAALEYAANSKESNYYKFSKDAAGYDKSSKGKKGGSSESGYETSKDVKKGSSSESNKSVNASYEASATNNQSTTLATENNSSYSRVGYTYTGPSAAIKNLPAIGK